MSNEKREVELGCFTLIWATLLIVNVVNVICHRMDKIIDLLSK